MSFEVLHVSLLTKERFQTINLPADMKLREGTTVRPKLGPPTFFSRCKVMIEFQNGGACWELDLPEEVGISLLPDFFISSRLHVPCPPSRNEHLGPIMEMAVAHYGELSLDSTDSRVNPEGQVRVTLAAHKYKASGWLMMKTLLPFFEFEGASK